MCGWFPKALSYQGPLFHGCQLRSDLTIGYEEVPIEGEAFEGQSVLILGRGNAAFEMAEAIYGNTNFIHMVARYDVSVGLGT